MIPETYFYLILAVAPKTVGTTALQGGQQFTKAAPPVVVVIGHATAFHLLSPTLRTMPVGVVHAMWSGLGIVFIALIGYLVFGQRLDWPAVPGMAMILGGIPVIYLFSRTAPH